ncbi:kinase-like domain-containing protein, partial [Massariosphaeria phaeospora]
LSKIMKREIQTCEMLRQNSHPNICAYLGVRCVGPHVIGLSFDRYKHTLTSLVYSRMEFDARHALQNITSGLMHLHRLGYVHCDIKPDNIFVNDIASHFVIGDFDSCHKRGKPLNAKTGTPRWMNAKLKTSKPADPADSTMDWWSLNLVKIWMQTKG